MIAGHVLDYGFLRRSLAEVFMGLRCLLYISPNPTATTEREQFGKICLNRLRGEVYARDLQYPSVKNMVVSGVCGSRRGAVTSGAIT